jgi:hypothetical protein
VNTNEIIFHFQKTHAMTPVTLSEAEYQFLKKKLHQAHDKLIKLTLQEAPAMRELTEKIIMPLLEGIKIDLDSLALDTTTYIRQNLQAFFSDIVYQALLTDGNTVIPQPARVALLVEHKSDMPTQLAVRLQALDYINAIMKKHYNKDTDKTIPVLTIIFNQFNKDWKPQSFRSQFPELSKVVSGLIPEFDLLVINLSSMSEEVLDSLDKYGTLKASLLAMKNVRNKRFLKKHFENIFVFLQKHPDKTDLRDQLITYLMGQSDLSGKDLEELISNIFSPVLKQEIMISGKGFLAVAAREAAAATKAEMQKKAEKAAKKAQLAIEAAKKEAFLKTRLTVMRGWNRDVSIDLITDMVDLPQNEVEQLIAAFEKVKAYSYSQTDVDTHELACLSGLSEFEVKALLVLLQKK